jgi:PII-like signaling protein
VETREKIEALLPEIEKRTGSGMIEIQETRVVVPPKN